MTRFARAKGSKSSNERLPEEATSWTEMKEQLLNKQKEASETEDRNAMNAKRLENFNSFLSEQKSKDSANSEWADFSNSNTITKQNNKLSTKNKVVDEVQGKKIKKRKTSNEDNNDGNTNAKNVTKPLEEMTKKKKKRKNDDDNKDVNTKVNNDEVNVQKPLEEMTKKKKKRKNNEDKKDVNTKVNNDEVNVQKPLEEMTKKKKKRKNVNDNKDVNTKVNNVQKPLKEMTEEERSSRIKKMERRRLQKEKRKLNKLNQNGMTEGKNDEEINSDPKGGKAVLEAGKGKEGKGKEKKQKVKGVMKPKKPMEDLTEEERKAVLKKQARRQRQLEKRKLLKEKKLAEQDENNRLQIESNNVQTEHPNKFNKPQIKKKPPKDRTGKEAKRKKPLPKGETMHINGKSIDIVYVDGFPVKKDDGERLAELKKTMISKGLPRSEVQAGMKLARRRAEKALTREKRNVCYKCRQSGHNLSECPNLMNEENISSGICFKCGSTEHTHFECKVVKRQEFKFATCFICNEQGHISKQCPDNARGLYPKGGACKLCGDVTHLKKDCPKHIAEQEANTIGLETIGGDVEGLDGVKTKAVVHNKPNKVVKFF